MKKYLLNTLGFLLVAYFLYWAIFYIPLFLRSFDPSGVAVMIVYIVFVVSMLLFGITGIGLLLKKNWSIVIYWIAIILILAMAVIYKAKTPLINSYLFLLLNIIAAIFVSTQWKKLGNK